MQKDWDLRSDAELCMVRRDSDGGVARIVLCRGSFVSVGDVMVRLKEPTDFAEMEFADGRASIVSGEGEIANE